MKAPEQHFRRRLAVAHWLAAFGAVGWLGGGTCHVSYCSEDCNPCVQQCKCNTGCNHSQAGFLEAHTLTRFVIIEHTPSGNVAQRTFSEIVGLSVERAGGADWPADADVVRFARGVLSANPAHLSRPGLQQEFVLDELLRYETAIVVQFHQTAPPGRENLISFLFDPHGDLIEIDQAASH